MRGSEPARQAARLKVYALEFVEGSSANFACRGFLEVRIAPLPPTPPQRVYPGGVERSGTIVGDKTMRLLKAMREQLGDTSASRNVDAEAAADNLGMESGTPDFDRRLHDLVRAGYLEPDPYSTAPIAQRMYRITFSGIYAADNY